METLITRLLEQEVVRVVLSCDRKTSHLIPKWQDIEVLESISKALSPIAELTDFLSGENHITISSVIPVLHNLKNKILVENDEDTSLTKDIFLNVIDDMQARYADVDMQQVLNITTFLDPRFKAEYAEDEDILKDSIEEKALELEMQEMIPATAPTSSNNSQPPPAKKRS